MIDQGAPHYPVLRPDRNEVTSRMSNHRSIDSWLVLRVRPGVQRPRRLLSVETTRSSKGYRIVPSLDPRVSAIERELSDRGLSCYMPAEFKAVRNRTKALTWSMRRNPLLPGYIFVSGTADWHQVPGVVGMLASVDGQPFHLSAIEMLSLRSMEANSEAAAERFIDKMRREATTESVRAARKSLAAARQRFNPGNRVKVLWGAEAGRTATVLGWSDQGKVRAIVDRLEAAEVVELPYEFIRRSDEAA